MNFLQILILGLVQGAAELLPVSSSAHVIVAEKLMGIDPSSPEATFLLVMLHTGTMVAVIFYFWNSWLAHYFSDAARLTDAVKNVVVATVITAIVGFALKLIIEKVFMHGQAKAEVEELFSNLPLIGSALFAAGLLILYSGSSEEKRPGSDGIDLMKALIIGVVQGLCLPFRGFSRSGGTISAGLLLGIERRQIEEFSFALAVVLTPLVVGIELLRLVKAHPEVAHGSEFMKLLTPGLLGMVCSFVAGYLALKLLSQLLETGRWKYFGYYCLIAALVVFGLAYMEKANATPTVTQSVPVPMAAPATTPDAAPSTNTYAPAALIPASTPIRGDTTDGQPAAVTNTAPDASATNAVPVTPLAPATDAPPVQPIPPATNSPPITPATTGQ